MTNISRRSFFKKMASATTLLAVNPSDMITLAESFTSAQTTHTNEQGRYIQNRGTIKELF